MVVDGFEPKRPPVPVLAGFVFVVPNIPPPDGAVLPKSDGWVGCGCNGFGLDPKRDELNADMAINERVIHRISHGYMA